MQRRAIHSPERASEVLARCGPDELARARTSRDRLLASARVLAGVLAHDPDRTDCTDAGCGLVHRLASVEPGHVPGEVPDPVQPGLEAATRRFERALTDAVEAIRRCRQTQHGSGRCWFAAVPHVDGCGEVLRTVHRLG